MLSNVETPSAFNGAVLDFLPRVPRQNKCPKLRFDVILDKSTFVAGEILYGRLELVSYSRHSLYLGEIAIELAGFEELDDKDEALMESFLSSRIVLQGPNRPPSRAVRGWRTQEGLWKANKGRFTFPFAFRLPGDIPSSVHFKSILAIKYKVTGFVDYKYSSRSKDTAFVSTDACVVERVDLRLERIPIKHSISERPWLSRGGPITIECTLRSPLVCAGQEARLDISIINSSSRKAQNLRMYIFRRLDLTSRLSPKHSHLDSYSRLRDFSPGCTRCPSICVLPGERRLYAQTISIPLSLLSVQKSTLGEVSVWILLSLGTGPFGRDISLEVPITVCHPLSLLPLPEVLPFDFQTFHSQHLQDTDALELGSNRQDEEEEKEEWDGGDGIPVRSCRSLSPERRPMFPMDCESPHQSARSLSPPPFQTRRLPWSEDYTDPHSDQGVPTKPSF